MLSFAEASAQLATINAAISEYYAGTRRRSLIVGGHEFNRQVTYADISITALLQERTRLQAIVDAYSPPAQVLFKGNTSFPLQVTKKPTSNRFNGGY
ncbi:MAG: hypothetical protein NTV98_05960 [Candidatus Roizmanbacteria bacterium]|nr:hypothetical protein [Candidatus Roizmanbacteria bacterium]